MNSLFLVCLTGIILYLKKIIMYVKYILINDSVFIFCESLNYVILVEFCGKVYYILNIYIIKRFLKQSTYFNLKTAKVCVFCRLKCHHPMIYVPLMTHNLIINK